jgi:hypothetical protein
MFFGTTDLSFNDSIGGQASTPPDAATDRANALERLV